MHIRIFARALVLVGAAFTIAACQYSPDTAQRTIAFNRSVAESTNQLILLNAIRSSKRNPTFYSHIVSNTAASTIAPALSASVPLAGSRTITNTVSATASSSSVATALGRAVTTLTPSLTLTEQNSLTLQNLDDQGSTNGVMTPVSMQIYQYFQSEGFNPEELFLMFIGSISMTQTQLKELTVLASTKCASVYSVRSKTWCVHLQDDKLPDCQPLPSADPDKTTLFFANDPALYEDGYPRAAEKFHSFRCFRAVARAFLALGLHPDSYTKHEFLYRAPLAVAKGNPRFLADLSQQGLEASISRGGQVTVCKKTDTVAFQLPSEIQDFLRQNAKSSQANHPSASDSQPDFRALASLVFTDTFGLASETNFKSLLAQPPAKTCEKAATDADKQAAADKKAEAADKKSEKDKGATKAGAPPSIGFGQRSLEAMIYYIGQIIRRRVELGVTDKDVTFLNGALSPYNPYEEELFRVRTGNPDVATTVQVASSGTTYYVPALCEPDSSDDGMAKARCSVEYPNDASPQILTLLNQIWGLNKTAAALPTTSNVTVVTPP